MAARAEEPRQVVGDVDVQGQETLKKRAILGKVKVRKGDVVVDPHFQADVDRLLETGAYEEVQVALEDMAGAATAQEERVRVIFRIKERPLIKRVDFKGNFRLPDSKFTEQMSSKTGEPFNRYNVTQDEQKILSVYRDEGYADAAVESYTSTNPKTKKIILTFFITEGNRILVSQVNVEGNHVLTDKKIRKIMKKTRRKKVFKEEDLREDMGLVQKRYKNLGYLDMAYSSDPDRRINDEKTKIDLTLHIEEGRRYIMGDFSFSGATLYSDKELRRAVTLKPGKLYNEDKFQETLKNLQDLYADKGYLRAEINPEPQKGETSASQARVDYHFSIHESSVVYVDRIYVDGNTYTKEQVIRREVTLKEGDVFSAGKVRRSVEKIYNLGFLDDVQVDVQQPRSEDAADLVFSVVEGKPGILSAGAGFSSVDGLLGTLQVQHINLFGRAQRLNLLWEFGQRKQNYEISWTDPWFLGKSVSFGVDVFDTVRLRPFGSDSTAYKEGRRGSGVNFGPRLSDRLSLIHSYSYEEIRIFDVDAAHVGNADPALNITASRNITSSITNGIVFDTRDNIFDATRGTRNSATVQTAGGPFGGTVHFYKPEAYSAVYIPTFWKFVLSFSGRVSYLRTYAPSEESDSNLISERFIIGGADTVRGYENGTVGSPVAYYMGVFNAEYKFPIVQDRNKTILQGAFFADLGGAWDRSRSINLNIGSRPNQMRAGAGFGIRFKTPVFPIRLDYGYGLNHREGESASQFYFTIGNIF